ncbi:MAG: zinc-ribbon domain-containing protein [Methanoregula sp.]|nr:zinc-ribbon domain-containing protein [Methanoregula sp.]
MFCGECGTQNPDTNQFCKNCGKPLKKTQQAPAPQPAAVPVPQVAAMPQAQPVYYPPQPAGVQPPGAVAGAPVKPPLNKGMLALAIVGVVLGIVSWFRYPYILSILAIVLGVVVVAKTEKKTSAVAIVAVLAILIGLACIVVDIFYFTIFPTPPLNL